MERSTDLQGRELDAAVTIAFFEPEPTFRGMSRNLPWAERPQFWSPIESRHAPITGWEPRYRFSSDANHTTKLRAEIERRGLQNHFCSILDDMTNDDPGMLINAWAFLNASPERQARAALKAVEGAHV